MKGIRYALAALAVVLAGAVATSGTALAGGPPPPTGTPTPTTGTGNGNGSGDTSTGQVKNCMIASSPSYLGLSCGGAGATGGLTIAEILGPDPVPTCWDEPMTRQELDVLGYTNTPGPGGSTWYWERCLHGIDPDTKTVLPEGITFTVGIVAIPNGDPVVTLTPRQQRLVRWSDSSGMIPDPVAAVSPAAHPRVGAQVAFFDGTTNLVTVNAGGVWLRARVTGFEVKPTGSGDSVSCPGSGVKATAGDTPSSLPNGCWYKYRTSSAAQVDQKYPALATTTWVAEYSSSPAGPWTRFNTFTKSQVTTIKVTEIQSLVVS